MIHNNSSRTAPVLIALLCVTYASNAQQTGFWPDRWLEASEEFGSLVIEYRLTNECDIDRSFEIVELPRIDVTRAEILGSIASFLRRGTREDIPDEAMTTASLEVFGQKTIPDRVIEKPEYDALVATLERLGTWPRIQTVPLGNVTIKCFFAPSGFLIKVERSTKDEDGYSDFTEDLSKQGPFRFRWEVEE